MTISPDEYTLSTNKALLDVDLVHRFLSEDSYWAQGRSLDVVQRSIEGSLCFGVYRGREQVGFARVVTDGATFGWLCDVFLLEEHRGAGLGKRLIEEILQEPTLQGLKTLLLATRDAHGFYEKYGRFNPLSNPTEWLVRRAKGKS